MASHRSLAHVGARGTGLVWFSLQMRGSTPIPLPCCIKPCYEDVVDILYELVSILSVWISSNSAILSTHIDMPGWWRIQSNNNNWKPWVILCICFSHVNARCAMGPTNVVPLACSCVPRVWQVARSNDMPLSLGLAGTDIKDEGPKRAQFHHSLRF
jgi:hypothetical protein